MNTYTYFTAVVIDAGMQNKSRLAIAMGIHIRKSQILALPCFDFVRSTIPPITRSLTPSKTFDTAMMVPTTPASSTATLVRYSMKNADMIPLTHARP